MPRSSEWSFYRTKEVKSQPFAGKIMTIFRDFSFVFVDFSASRTTVTVDSLAYSVLFSNLSATPGRVNC
jgi:hypothetical protein